MSKFSNLLKRLIITNFNPNNNSIEIKNKFIKGFNFCHIFKINLRLKKTLLLYLFKKNGNICYEN